MLRAEKPAGALGKALALAGKFRRIGAHERRLVIEAAGLLSLARGMTLIVPFRQIARAASRPLRPRAMSGETRARTIGDVRLAIERCAPRLPWRTLCFEQGLAAQWMLRRRGIDTVLYYGAAAKGESGLCAHVWVRDGDSDVIGCEAAPQFAVLAAFPPKPAA